MTSLLHISDTHFGTETQPVADALVRFAKEKKPQLLVLSGDITQHARASQFQAAGRFIDRLDIAQRIVLPGNHDLPLLNLPARLFWPLAVHRRTFGDLLEPIFESADLLVMGVNTTRWYRRCDGEVSRGQIERIAHVLEHASGNQLRVVVVHQPVVVTKPQDQKHLLHGHASAVQVWVHAGVDLILGGHVHLPYVVPLHRRFDDLPKTAWAVQAGTSVSSKTRPEAANSVNLIHYTGGKTRRSALVERWDYVAAQKRFQQIEGNELNFHDFAPQPDARSDEEEFDE
ncbi:MAG TPA: metallophosphoesterase [Rhizobacter sp.]|nr:metallophosphoesterase [Rhizobacter sp.]